MRSAWNTPAITSSHHSDKHMLLTGAGAAAAHLCALALHTHFVQAPQAAARLAYRRVLRTCTATHIFGLTGAADETIRAPHKQCARSAFDDASFICAEHQLDAVVSYLHSIARNPDSPHAGQPWVGRQNPKPPSPRCCSMDAPCMQCTCPCTVSNAQHEQPTESTTLLASATATQ